MASALDGIFQGIGYTVILVIMCVVREFLGNGTFGGGILSILIMYLLYRTKLFSMVGISMAGGVMHNLGQLLTACAIMSNLSLMSYFAVLFFSGLISGILIGILAYSIEKRLPADFR